MTTLNRESTSSIQLALELEHSLNHDHDQPDPPSNMSDSAMATPNPETSSAQYDSDVLTSIITQLRADVARVTRERDESTKAIADAGVKNAALEARTADLSELLDAERARAEKAELERDQALKAAQDNEEQVNLLRAKVEESRRGLMRLQAESRRMSTQGLKTGPLPLDLSVSAGARSPGLASGFPSAMSAKRASFNPPNPSSSLGYSPSTRPNGSGHRRISSMSDPGHATEKVTSPGTAQGLAEALPVIGIDGLPPSPATHTFEDLRTGDGSTIKTKRFSLLAKRDGSPPNTHTPSVLALTAEVDSLRAELTTVKKELDDAKRDLGEANDKRDAADACIKALREFIAEQAVGETSNAAPSENTGSGIGSPVVSLKGLRLPPLPTENNIPEEAASPAPKKPASGGWGLKLWGSSSTTAAPANPRTSSDSEVPTQQSTAAAPAPANGDATSPTSTPLSSFVSSWTRSVSSAPSQPSQTSISSSAVSSEPTSTTLSPANSAAAPKGIRKFSFFTKAPAPPAPVVAQSSSSHSIAPSISSSATPELTHSELTSPRTDTRSLTSAVLTESDAEVASVAESVDGKRLSDVLVNGTYVNKETKGDVTPTLSASEVEAEPMHAVAL